MTSYWDWTAAAKEEKVDIISLANIEPTDLIQSAATVSATKESHLVATYDDYWADYQQSARRRSSCSCGQAPAHLIFLLGLACQTRLQEDNHRSHSCRREGVPT